ncbi:hypothetical protein IMZ48_02925 [Candidatus Bathyarchaeota archaeon]|nr:hypothetical protein [Candidatus Bathyarchaeota archaeon]
MRAAITAIIPIISSFTSFTRPFTLRAARSAFAEKPTFIYITSRGYAKKSKMAPKKPVEENKVQLGRPGNSLKSGIVRPAAASP